MKRRLIRKAYFKVILPPVGNDNFNNIIILRDPDASNISRFITPRKHDNLYYIDISIDGHVYVTSDDEPVFSTIALLKDYDSKEYGDLPTNIRLMSFKVEPNSRIILLPRNHQPPGAVVDLAKLHTSINNAETALKMTGLVDDQTIVVGPNLKPTLTVGEVASYAQWDDVDWVGNGKKVDRTFMDTPPATNVGPSIMQEDADEDDDET